MRISRGERAGQLIELRQWQQQLLVDLAAAPFRRALIGLPRKNGKSLFGSIVALYSLMADREAGAVVVSAAADRDQARLVFGEAQRLVELDPYLSKHLTVYRNEILHKPSGSRYRVLSSEAYTKEGLDVFLAVVDELHAHPARDLYDVLSLATGARKHPLVLAITTAGVRYDRNGRDTLCYELYEYGKRLQAGEADDPDFFFRWWEPSRPDVNHEDPAVWAEANPAFGDWLEPVDFEAAVRVTPENEFRMKRLNTWTAAQTAWLPYGAWEGCVRPAVVAPGAAVVLGFDGSFSGDSTALVAATVEAEPFVFPVECWERPLQAPGAWRVDHALVEAAVLEACRRWNVRELVADPHLWQRDMEAWAKQKVPVVEFPQGPARMVPATRRFYEAVVTGVMRHDGDPQLARHVGNAVVRPNGQLSKEHKDSGRKIDLAVAAVMAYERAAVLGAQPVRRAVIW